MNNSEWEFKEPEEWRKDMRYGVFVGTAVIGTIGNMLIIWIIMAHKSMRTKLNTFILNMAISDLMVSFTVVPLYGYQEIYNKWIFGAIACTVQEIIETVGLCVFILALMMASMERHYAIIPQGKKVDMDTITMTSLEIWISSVILSAPNWIFATLIDGFNSPICIQIWPDAETGNSSRAVYKIFFLILTYILPLVYMIYRFTRLSINIWMTKTWPTSTENKQSVKMILVVVLVYGITSLPYRLCILFYEKCSTLITPLNEFLDFFVFPSWLILSNVMWNPYIYICMDKKFKLGFNKAIRWLPFVHYNPDNILEDVAEPIIKRFVSIPDI